MTVAHSTRWVMDTSTFSHFCRAGHADLLRQLAPEGLILIPDTVWAEVETGRDRGYGIPSIADLPWVELAVLTPDEELEQLLIKAEMPSKKGDSPRKNLGECAVLSCAIHRGMVAVIDDGDARIQAKSRGVRFVNSMWIVAEAYKTIENFDAEQVYEDLVATGMRLPRVESFIGWAYEVGLLP